MTDEIPTETFQQPGAWAIIHCAVRGTFLFGKRSSLVAKAGAWNFFGGRIDPGEAPLTALVRELAEEAGLSVNASQLIELGCLTGVKAGSSGESFRQFHYYLLAVDHELSPQLNHEHSESAWFSLETLPERLNRPTALAIQNGLLERARALLPPPGDS